MLTLPEGNDPCEFLQKHGADAFRGLIERDAVGALDHAFRAETRGVDFEQDVNAADRAIERLLTIVAQAPRLGSRTDAIFDGRFLRARIGIIGPWRTIPVADITDA